MRLKIRTETTADRCNAPPAYVVTGLLGREVAGKTAKQLDYPWKLTT